MVLLIGLAVPAAIMLAMLAFAVGTGIGGIAALKKLDSPFLKIVSNTWELFRADPRLWVIPACLFVFIVDLLTVPFGVLPMAALHVRFDLKLWACMIASTAVGACAVSVANAVMAEDFAEQSEGRPAGLWRSLARTAASIPSLVVFGLLWGLTLGIGYFLLTQLGMLARRQLGRPAELAVIVVTWALELGFTMATYFMLLMIVREGLGPFRALGRAVALAKADFGGNLGEVFALKAVAYYCFVQTLQLILAAASYLFVREGVVVCGFTAADFDHVVGLRPASLAQVLGSPVEPLFVAKDAA